MNAIEKYPIGAIVVMDESSPHYKESGQIPKTGGEITKNDLGSNYLYRVKWKSNSNVYRHKDLNFRHFHKLHP